MKFFQTWPTYLKINTEYTLGWSYIICIVGLVFTILSAVCLGIAGWVIRKFTFEQKQEKLINEQLSRTKVRSEEMDVLVIMENAFHNCHQSFRCSKGER